MLGNIEYRVELSGFHVETDKITEVVNQIIVGGAADLSVLADPEIPELRNEKLTLDEALNDPDFGSFIPDIPSRFDFDGANRFLNQDSNNLFITWSSYPTFDVINWNISKANNRDRELIVSPDEREKYDLSLYPTPWMDSVPEDIFEFVMQPTFLAEDLTLDMVRARVIHSRSGSGDTVQIQLNVLYGDIIINVTTTGLSPEQVWDMLVGL